MQGKMNDVGGIQHLDMERRQRVRAARGGVPRTWSSSELRRQRAQDVGGVPLSVCGRMATPLIYTWQGRLSSVLGHVEFDTPVVLPAEECDCPYQGHGPKKGRGNRCHKGHTVSETHELFSQVSSLAASLRSTRASVDTFLSSTALGSAVKWHTLTARSRHAAASRKASTAM